MSQAKGIPNWKVPMFLVDRTSVAAFSIFNPNDWPGDSKPVIWSCAAQAGLLHYATVKVGALFQQADQLCQRHFLQLKDQREKGDRWSVEKFCYFVPIPEVHFSIQGFLGATKTLLDLVVQLASTEGIVRAKVHGFHRDGDRIGGKVLKILDNNAAASKKPVASRLSRLLEEEKKVWIDEVVQARDGLIHPERGMSQVMFALELRLDQGELRLVRIVRPSVGSEAFDRYAEKTLWHVDRFSKAFLGLLRSG